ncbi:PREDICTED: XK-related protein 6-like [Branchiostoma belcheri]|uniref:XK-related protein n=1 Tax=Branchiostoma belcheri TaxID=7741 RepID=A0A6P4YUM2_BRABE|nr:PREDICTED: XK-related protein 6-like [Branchiostoma belcheri]
MDHPETDTPPAANQIPEVATPPARTGLCSRFLSAWNSNPVQMRLVLISLLLYMADVITDIMLAKQYYSNGDYHWFGWTIGFVMAPPAVMNILLLVYDIDLLDIKLSLRKWEKCLLNFSCFALPVMKYVEIINLLDGGKEVKESLKKNLHRFHLVEVTLESLPQLCLQICIIFSTHEQVSVLKVITMVISLLAAVKAVVTYVGFCFPWDYTGW